MRKQWTLTALVTALLIGCGGGGIENNTPLPNSIQDMQLQNIVTGEQAQDELKKLHQKTVTSAESYIGEYQGNEYNARMYVTAYTGRDSALAALNAMANRMMDPHGGAMQMGFQHVRKLNKYGDHVYMALQGQRAHYFYVEDSNLYWLDIDPHVAMPAMGQLVGVQESADADTSGMMMH